MSTLVIIPAKPYAEAKSRLASCLSAEQRRALSRYLLLRTVRLAAAATGKVLVISRDPALLDEARAAGAMGLLEEQIGLNPALEQATHFARHGAARAVLVLPADLPLLTSQDIEGILACATRPPMVAIAPCRHGVGTNALLICPPGLVGYAFGPDSFRVHRAAAEASGAQVRVVRSPGLAFDLDTTEDWADLRAAQHLDGYASTYAAAVVSITAITEHPEKL